jgi:hypothetical protein
VWQNEGSAVKLSKWPVSVAVTVIALILAPRLLVGLAVAIPIGAMLAVASVPEMPAAATARAAGTYAGRVAREVAERALLLPELAFVAVVVGPEVHSAVSRSLRRSVDQQPVALRVVVLVLFGALLGYLGQRLWRELPWSRRRPVAQSASSRPRSNRPLSPASRPEDLAGHRFGEAIYLGVASIPLFALGTPQYSSVVVGLLYLCPLLLSRVAFRANTEPVHVGLAHRVVAHWAFVVSRPTHGGHAG